MPNIKARTSRSMTNQWKKKTRIKKKIKLYRTKKAKSGNGRKRKKNRDQQRKKITSLQMKCSVDNGIVTQKRSIVVCVLFFVFFVLDDYTNLLSWSFKWRHIESPLNMHVLSKHKQIIIYLMIYKLRLNKTKHSEKNSEIICFQPKVIFTWFFSPDIFHKLCLKSYSISQ